MEKRKDKVLRVRPLNEKEVAVDYKENLIKDAMNGR